MNTWYRLHNKAILLNLYVRPGAKRSEIVGLHGNALKLKLAAPPVEGRANEALLKFIAKLFNVPERGVIIKQGEHSRRKLVEIVGSTIAPETVIVGE